MVTRWEVAAPGGATLAGDEVATVLDEAAAVLARASAAQAEAALARLVVVLVGTGLYAAAGECLACTGCRVACCVDELPSLLSASPDAACNAQLLERARGHVGECAAGPALGAQGETAPVGTPAARS